MAYICVICDELLSSRPTNMIAEHQEVDVIVTKCGHLYHQLCVEDWWNRGPGSQDPGRKCPICQSVVNAADSRKIFPSGNEDTDRDNANLTKMKEKVLKENNGRMKAFEEELQGVKEAFEKEKLVNDIERYKLYKDAYKSQDDLRALKSQHAEKVEMYNATVASYESSFKEKREEIARFSKHVTGLEERYKAMEQVQTEDRQRKMLQPIAATRGTQTESELSGLSPELESAITSVMVAAAGLADEL